MGARELGVVVVGTGFGCRVHVPAARAAGLDVVGLVGRDPEKTRRRARRAGVERVFGSIDEALAVPGADAFIIATPPHMHAPLAGEVIAAGRHVLVEKPFTLDAAEARRLHDAAACAGVVALVGHEFRFAPERATVRDAIRRGYLGTPRLATLVSHISLAASTELRTPAWWFDPARGGGWLGASVSHLVDTVRWWLDDFSSVSAVLPMVSERDPATSAEDTVSARFTLQGGVEGILQQSAAVWGGGLEVLRVAGTDGTVEARGAQVHLDDRQGRRALPPVGPPPPVEAEASADPRHRFTHLELGPAAAQAQVLRDLVQGNSPRQGTASPATFADGLACMEVLDAIRASAGDGGRLISVEPRTAASEA